MPFFFYEYIRQGIENHLLSQITQAENEEDQLKNIPV